MFTLKDEEFEVVIKKKRAVSLEMKFEGLQLEDFYKELRRLDDAYGLDASNILGSAFERLKQYYEAK